MKNNNFKKLDSVMVRQESRPVSSKDQGKYLEVWAKKAFFDPVRVELNNKAKIGLFVLYTALVASLTIVIFQSIHYQDNLAVLNNVIPNPALNYQEEELKTVKIDSSQLAYTNKLLVEQMRNELIRSLDEKDKERNHLIQSKDEKIQELNQRIDKLLVQLDVKNANSTTAPKNMTYSYDNEEILRKEQEIVERSFKSNQKIQKEAYMGLLDLNRSDDQKKLESFISKQQLELFKLQRAFEKERREFRSRSFRIAVTKTPEEYLKFLEE